MLLIALSSFLVACAVTGAIIWGARRGLPFLQDSDFSGPQKFHHQAVPRVGGIGITAGLVSVLGVWAAFSSLLSPSDLALLGWLALSASLAFGAGLLEDVTKRVPPKQRLLATLAAAALAAWALDAVIWRTDIPGVDWLVSHPIGAVALTLLVVAGVSNAVNIIDGFNGLASMCAVLMLLGLAWVAYQVGDDLLLTCALAGVGATLGFFVWNYPGGRIFLGDGGAYFLGFYVAVLGVLLLVRHPEVSPLCALLLVIYPAYETLFSIYRRVVLRGSSPGSPDATHLHTLLFRRVVSCGRTRREMWQRARRNSLTAPYLWALSAMSVVPASLWWDNSAVLGLFIAAFLITYTWLYWRIVRCKTPRWLKLIHRRPARQAAPIEDPIIPTK